VVFAILEVLDANSSRKIKRAVRKTKRSFQKHLEVDHGWPKEIKIPELKGYDPYWQRFKQARKERKDPEKLQLRPTEGKIETPGLSSHQDICNLFFSWIAKADRLRVYIVYLPKKTLKEKPPKDLARRYADLLRNLLPSLQYPPKKVVFVVDKRSMETDHPEIYRKLIEKIKEQHPELKEKIKHRYPDKSEDEIEKEVKKMIREEYLPKFWRWRFNQMITDTIYKKFKRRPEIYHQDSEKDECLQVADNIAHFFYRYKDLNLNQHPDKVSKEEREKNEKRKEWFKAYDILKRRSDYKGKKIEDKPELEIVWRKVERLGRCRRKIRKIQKKN